MSNKKILVINNQMELGGVCIAAKNFIENMKDDYDIEFMLAKHNGDLESRLPEAVKISYMQYPLAYCPMTRKEVKKMGFWHHLKKVFIIIIERFLSSKLIDKLLCNKNPKNDNVYDIVINNDMDMTKHCCGACHLYAKNLVKAKKKALVIHGDFFANNYDVKFFKKEYLPTYDYIITLTNYENERLKNYFSEYAEKFVMITNFQADEEIKKLSLIEEVKYDKERINIVSASRLTEVKGYKRSLEVFKRLKEDGVDFSWHILGDGEQHDELSHLIKDYNLTDQVFLHGVKNNPYPYMRGADILYLGSYHESYGLVLIESMLVGTPVITTKTIAAEEIVNDMYGWVCDNSTEGIYNVLKTVLSNQNLLDKKRKNLQNYVYDNKSIKLKYEEIINS